MTDKPTSRQTPPEASFAELFTPKIVTILREGYGFPQLRADVTAGLTVAIVALPLSMAIAIACGVPPDRGLYTAIFGGFMVSLLGGSRFQVGGPAGAFITLVALTVQRHGIDGLILATTLSGLILVAVGYLRLGTYIKFIPYPVTVGFTAGIGVIILYSQIKELLGLTLDKVSPQALWAALPSASPASMGLAFGTIALIGGLKRWRPSWPGLLIAIAMASVAAALLGLPVDTLQSRFGGIAAALPVPAFPALSWDKVWAVLPDAGAFALLGAIESLLSAVVADGMTGRRHRSNCELVGQGVANVVSGLFGGFCVTGTIARTATNVRAGAHGPVAGMSHSVILLLFMLIAAPLAGYIPLAALAGVLAIVAWNMIEKHAIAALLRASRADSMVLGVTFFLTVFRDLSEAIVVGSALGSILFIHRLSQTTAVEDQTPLVPRDQADDIDRPAYHAEEAADPNVVVYRISGALFFGAAYRVATILDRIADSHKTLVLDLSAVPFLDSSGAHTIEGVVAKASKTGGQVIITGASPPLRRELLGHGIRPPRVKFARTVETAMAGLEKARAKN